MVLPNGMLYITSCLSGACIVHGLTVRAMRNMSLTLPVFQVCSWLMMNQVHAVVHRSSYPQYDTHYYGIHFGSWEIIPCIDSYIQGFRLQHDYSSIFVKCFPLCHAMPCHVCLQFTHKCSPSYRSLSNFGHECIQLKFEVSCITSTWVQWSYEMNFRVAVAGWTDYSNENFN